MYFFQGVCAGPHATSPVFTPSREVKKPGLVITKGNDSNNGQNGTNENNGNSKNKNTKNNNHHNYNNYSW